MNSAISFERIDKPWLVAVGIAGIVCLFVLRFIQHRLFYRNLPCPPHSMFWGHLKLMGKYMQKLPPGSYTHNILTQMKLDYELPDIFYLDLWPAGPCFLICTSPDACVISTTKNAYDISDVVRRFFNGNVGTSFIEATNGPLWKHLHQMFAPGLTSSVIRGHTGAIIDQAMALQARLRDIANHDEVVDVRLELGTYPFQVIGIVLLGETLRPRAYEDAKRAIDTQAMINATLNPISKWRLRKELNECFRRIEHDVEAITRKRYAYLRQQTVLPTKNSVAILLDRMLLSHLQSGQDLEHSLVRMILENINGFLVAGFGTTTDTSTYIFMLLSVFPHALKKLREEHDRVFDKDIDKTVKMLRENPGLINELTYTTAVINETLRMFPIGFVVRSAPANMTTLEYMGRRYPIKGHIFGISSHTMHFNPDYFSEPKEFNPERFIGDHATFHRHAYRPFERGLRSCLGQPLAMDEMKIMLVLVARWFNFELRDQEAVAEPVFSFTDLDTKLGRHAFQGWSFTATPSGPVNMKVSLVT